jgi:flagellar motor switch protein FliM
VSTETLSQSEIDLLFSGGAPADKPKAVKPKRDVQMYDFRRPHLISKDRMRGLEAMYGMISKSFESWLIAWTRGQVNVELMSVEHFSFGEFLLSLPTPCASFAYNFAESDGQQAVLDFGRELSFYLVDRLLGGSGAPVLLERALTPLERMIVRIAADRAATQLSDAWKDHVRFSLSLARFESMPDMLQAAGRDEPVLVAQMLVRAGEIQSPLMLCLPFVALERFFTSNAAQTSRTRGTASTAVRGATDRAVRNVRVPFVVELPEIAVKLRDIAAIRPGYTLRTGLSPNASLTAFVQGEPRFRGAAGRVARNLGFRVTNVLACEHTPVDTVLARRLFNTNNTMNEPVALAEMSDASVGGEPRDIATLYDLTLPVTIELGRTTMSVQDVLGLARGSVIQLDRLVGEPIDVFVGDRRFAQGEVVVIGEEFGVRITRMVSAGTFEDVQ